MMPGFFFSLTMSAYIAEITVLGRGSYSANSAARLLVKMNVRRDQSWAHFDIQLIEKLLSLLISV